jgi:flagellar assembly factor FliW
VSGVVGAGPVQSATVGSPQVIGRQRQAATSSSPVADCSVPSSPEPDVALPELTLVRPMPGFGDLTRFVLVLLAEEGTPDDECVLYELRSVEEPAVRFLVAVPTAFFPGYAFDLEEETCAELALQDAAEALVLVLLTIGDDSASTTANLLAPVVINARTRSAVQVILAGTDWPVRAVVV